MRRECGPLGPTLTAWLPVLNGGREGGRFGPEAFRRFLPKMGAAINPEYGVDLRKLRVVELGDAQGDSAESGREALQVRAPP